MVGEKWGGKGEAGFIGAGKVASFCGWRWNVSVWHILMLVFFVRLMLQDAISTVDISGVHVGVKCGVHVGGGDRVLVRFISDCPVIFFIIPFKHVP